MMSQDRVKRLSQLLIRWVLVVVPTILIGYVTLYFLNFSYTSLNTGIFSQSVYFGVGVLIAYSLYYFRARWVITFILLVLTYWAIEKIINRLPGEFDVFYATARFQLYSTIFIFGWVFGFLLARLRWSHFVVFGVLATTTLVSISNTVDVSVSYVLVHIAPVVVYGLYLLFLSPLLASDIELSGKKVWRLALRTVLFIILIFLAFLLAASFFKSDLKSVEKELAARGVKGKDESKQDQYDERNGLMEKGKGGDDGYRLKDTMRVNSKMSQSEKLMFCSKLDNYFPDGSPAPLYFVAHYLTRYDQVKETFTRDVDVPSFDEMDADPASLPMYYSVIDTSIVRKSMSRKFRNIVEAQVYLSENTWKHSVLGPSSVFSIQTIPVEKDFQKMFLSAYKIYSYASDLNNAYFVYNISANPRLVQLQDKRHDELRSVKDYKNVRKKFLEYYTQYPSGGIYDSISKLANGLTTKNSRPVDKVIAVRDFFLKRNEHNERVFRYTINAGAVDDPNIPSSKMLYNFLFKTHAGYCTYYAGASLFMLRALGIPARFTTGFATINRSDKNKGWYWFYASQAHAWTQVYFPDYGWLDFDMTIGNEDQQEAPKPDGTPPLPPPEPLYVLNAKAESVDVKAKKMVVTFNQLIYLKAAYTLNKTFTRPVNALGSRVVYNKRDTSFSAVHAGDSMLIVSYKRDAGADPHPSPGLSIEQLITQLPSPTKADEIYLRGKENEKKKDASGKSTAGKEKSITWQEAARIGAAGLLGILIFLLLLPAIYLCFRLMRAAFAKSATAKADQVYRLALYRFHMAGFERENKTPLEYARENVDPALNVGFEEFMLLYLRLKYSHEQGQPGQAELIDRFARGIGPAIRKKNNMFINAFRYFNVLLAVRYFQQPVKTDFETTTL